MDNGREQKGRSERSGQRFPESGAAPGRLTGVQVAEQGVPAGIASGPGKSTLTECEPALQLYGGQPGKTTAPADTHRAAAEGVARASQPLPHLDKIQKSFGRHDVSHVVAEIGGAAVAATRAVGAMGAYAYGDRIAFASSPDLRTAAHEAAHVVQQCAGVSGLDGGIGRAGDRYEQHADEVAEAVVAGASAEALLDRVAGGEHGATKAAPQVQRDAPRAPASMTAMQYLEGDFYLDQTLTRLLEATRLVNKGPYAKYLGDLDLFRIKLTEELVSGDKALLPWRLRRLIQPEQLETIIDRSRARDWEQPDENKPPVHTDKGPGTTTFLDSVVLDIANAIARAYRASMERVFPRLLGQWQQKKTEQVAPDAPPSADFVKPWEVLASHPMDTVVARALCAKQLSINFDGAAKEFPELAKTVSALNRKTELKRPGKLFRWVEAVPADRTAEEVATALFGSAEDAFRLIPKPPLWGFWAHDVPDIKKGVWRALHPNIYVEHPGPREPYKPGQQKEYEDAPNDIAAALGGLVGGSSAELDPVEELLSGGATNQVYDHAKATLGPQKPGVAHDEANIVAMLIDNLDVVGTLGELVPLFGYSTDGVEALTMRLAKRRDDAQNTCLADPETWYQLAEKQSTLLGSISTGLSNAAAALVEQGGPSAPEGIKGVIAEVVEPYMRALAALDLTDIAEARVKAGDQKLATLEIAIQEAKLHEGLGSIDYALGSDAKVGQHDYDPKYALDRTNLTLEQLAEARANLAGGNADAANATVAAVKPKVDDIEFEITLGDKLVRLDALWKAIDNEEDWWESGMDATEGRILKGANRGFYDLYFKEVYTPFMAAKKETDPDKQKAAKQAAKDKFKEIFDGKAFVDHGKAVIKFLKKVAKHKKWTKIIVGIGIAFAAFMLGQWAFSAVLLEATVFEAAVVGGIVATGSQVALEKIIFGHNPTLGGVLTGLAANTAIFFIVGKMALAAKAAGVEAELATATAEANLAKAGTAAADATGAAADAAAAGGKGITAKGAATAVAKYGAGLVKEMIIAEAIGIVQGNVANLIDHGRLLTTEEMQEMFVQQIAGVIGMRVAQHGFDASVKEFHRIKQDGISRDVQWLLDEQHELVGMGEKLHEEAQKNPNTATNREAIQEFLARWREYLERERATREKILAYAEKYPGKLNAKAVDQLRTNAGNSVLEAQVSNATALTAVEQIGPNMFRCDTHAFDLVVAQHKSAGSEIVKIETEPQTGRRKVTIQPADGAPAFTIKENLPAVGKRTAMNISVNEARAFETWLEGQDSPLVKNPAVEQLRELYLRDPKAAIALAAEKHGYPPHEVRVNEPYIVRPETQKPGATKDGGYVTEGGKDLAAKIGDVTAISDTAFMAEPGRMQELRAEWQTRHGHEPTKISYDPETNSVHFEGTVGKGADAKQVKIVAELGPKIRSFNQLDAGPNRVVGEPCSVSEGHDILRGLTSGDPKALEKVGLGGDPRMPADAHVEFGLGITSDGRAVIIRGERGAVDWAHLPGLKPGAHTHPSVPGNDLLPNAAGERKVAITDLLSVTKDPSLNRELIMPSAPDFVVTANLAVDGHVVFTPFVKKGEYLVKAAPGEKGPRLEWKIHKSTEVGTTSDNRRVYKSEVEGLVGGESIIREEIWIIQDGPDGSGHLYLEKPGGMVDKPVGGKTTPSRTASAAPMPPVDVVAKQKELAGAADAHVAKGKKPVVPYEVRVDPDFATKFRSEKGLAVFDLQGDKAVIHASPHANPPDVIAELYHLRQLEDPVMAREIRQHAGADMGKWDKMSVSDRVEHLRRKLRIEIDAHEKMRADKIEGAAETLANLEAIQEKIERLSPEEIAEMNAGRREVDPMFADPAHLFGKSEKVVAPRPARDGKFTKKGTAAVDRAGPERSTAYNDSDVKAVRQLGHDWEESLQITAHEEGDVSVHTDAKGTTVIVKNASGEHAYPLEPGTKPTKTSGKVKPGELLAAEVRRYRLVEIEYTDPGKPKQRREEIRRLDDAKNVSDKDPGGWVQRGSDSTRAGRIMEDAARRQLSAQLGAKIRHSGGTFDWVRVKHSRGGGGFDDVIFEFTIDGDTIKAKIRIREVKDYPDRYVSKAEFTAISGKGLKENLSILETMITEAQTLIEGDPTAVVFETPGLTAEHVDAVKKAFDHNDVEVEVVLGPDTLLGSADGAGKRVLKDLQSDVDGQLKKGAFKTNPDRVKQNWVETAQKAEQ